jgi:glutathione S-transferase
MKVFGPHKSTNVARVLVFLEEVGAEYEMEPIDFTAGELRSPAHVARHVISFVSSIFFYPSFI